MYAEAMDQLSRTNNHRRVHASKSMECCLRRAAPLRKKSGLYRSSRRGRRDGDIAGFARFAVLSVEPSLQRYFIAVVIVVHFSGPIIDSPAVRSGTSSYPS